MSYRSVLNVSNGGPSNPKTYTRNKQPSDKTQSSKFCQLDAKRIRFQNRKRKRKRIFHHSTTLIGPLKPYLAENITLQSFNWNILGLTATVAFFSNEAPFT